MKTLIVILILMAATLTFAADKTWRDQYGNVVGTWEGNSDRYQMRDQYGNDVGTRTRDGNSYQYRDEYGNKTYNESDRED